MPPAFEILRPDVAPRPILGHVPHAARLVPPEERVRLRLDDAGLESELLRLTDAHTDRLFAWVRDLGGTLFVNRVSRLVVDPERFADDVAEPMSAVGQGAVYTRTSGGAPLRADDPAERRRLLDRWFVPYHVALTEVVAATIRAFGSCLVLDCHSFASVPLPSEPDRDPDRPDICIGTDPFHTPGPLAGALRAALEARGFRVAVDRPFAGSLVPLRWYGTDARVASAMLEVRRDTYMDEATGTILPAFDDVAARLRGAVDGVLGRP